MSQEIIFGEKVSGVEYVSRLGAYFIVFDNKKIALIRTSKGYFLPGGGIDDGESHDKCLRREALEELGWEIEVGEYLGNAKNYFFAPRTNSYTILDGYFYLAKKIRKSAEPIEEDHKLIWLDYKEAIDKMWLPSQAWAIEGAYKKISQ